MAGVKGRSGRKPRIFNRAITESLLAESSPVAAKYLKGIAAGTEKPNAIRVDVCKYVIDQDCGRPTQRHDIGGTGEPITLQVIYDEPETPPEQSEP